MSKGIKRGIAVSRGKPRNTHRWLAQQAFIGAHPVGAGCSGETSGSKGLQVYVSLNRAVTYDDTKPFAREMAAKLEREHPDLVASKMNKSLRSGKVFVDWSQNDEHKTTVCVYSLRAKQRPMVSTPVTWAEVASTVKRGDPDPIAFDAARVLRRVEQRGDLFAPVLKLKQRLPASGSKR